MSLKISLPHTIRQSLRERDLFFGLFLENSRVGFLERLVQASVLPSARQHDCCVLCQIR